MELEVDDRARRLGRRELRGRRGGPDLAEILREPPDQRAILVDEPQLEQAVEEESAGDRLGAHRREGEGGRRAGGLAAAPDPEPLAQVARGVGPLERGHLLRLEVGRGGEPCGRVVSVEEGVAGLLAPDVDAAAVAHQLDA